MLIDVYADSMNLFTEEFLNSMDSNIVTIDVPENIMMGWYKEKVLAKYYSSYKEEEVDDLFSNWLDIYTCDDTEDLYDYVAWEMNGITPIIQRIWK